MVAIGKNWFKMEYYQWNQKKELKNWYILESQ